MVRREISLYLLDVVYAVVGVFVCLGNFALTRHSRIMYYGASHNLIVATLEDMPKIIELNTERLNLRQWHKDDYKNFALINADPLVMEFFPSVLPEDESNSLAKKIKSLIKKRGWGLWAVELKSKSKFIGFVGLHIPEIELPFNPCVEIGWRLSKEFWGNGFATEAAKAALEFAFETLCLREVVSFTSLENKRSQAVMERLGMINTGQYFKHPSIPVGSPLSDHVLYLITKAQWDDIITARQSRISINSSEGK